MARFPSIDSEGAFEAPEVQDHIKQLVTGSTDGITVDTSVGTRVFVGDTMIHGDTGLRNMLDTPFFGEGWSGSSSASGATLLTRVGNRVYLRGEAGSNSSRTNLIFSPPPGFRPASRVQIAAGSGYRVNTESSEAILVSRNIGVRYQTLTEPTGTNYISCWWETDDPWPTSLPGTPY